MEGRMKRRKTFDCPAALSFDAVDVADRGPREGVASGRFPGAISVDGVGTIDEIACDRLAASDRLTVSTDSSLTPAIALARPSALFDDAFFSFVPCSSG
jgi:hypothetical protein